MRTGSGRRHWPVRLLALIAALTALAAATFGGVQAQETQGEMSAPTLSSDTAGTIVISWETHRPAPSDYRIDYAKSGEDYTSWTVDEGHVYPAGTQKSATVTGLDPGAEYKVRMRARYNAGDYAENPWSGPWTGDVLITVAAGEDTSPPSENEGVVIIDSDEEPLIAEEQNAVEVLVSNLSLIGGGVTTLIEDGRQIRQGFDTGPNRRGYRISSVTLRMRANFSVTLPGTFAPVVTVIPSDSDDTLYTFNTPTDFSSSMSQSYSEVTFTAPDDAVLKANTNYRLLLVNDQSSLTVENDSGDSQESDHGWEIADGASTFAFGSWAQQTVSVLMAISGEALPDALVSNLKQTPDSSATVSDTSRAAQSFTTGPGLAGFGYRFDGVLVEASLETAGESPSPQVSLHTDESGAPGPRLYTLTPDDSFPDTITGTEWTLTAPPNTVLAAGTTYWVVFTNSATDDDYLLSTTNSGDEDQDPPLQDGWSIGDGHQTSTGSPPQWESRSRSIRMTVHGAPSWVTVEPADRDLPGPLQFARRMGSSRPAQKARVI